MTAALAFVAATSGAAGLLTLLAAPRRTAGGDAPPAEGAAAGTGAVAARGRSGRALVLLAAVGRRLRPRGAPADLHGRIEAAGRPVGLGVRELMAAKVAAALMAGAAVLPAVAVAPGRLGFAAALLAPAAGFLGPDLWLGRLAAERARRVRRDLPALLDILSISVEAGGSLVWALREVGERAEGPLASEWSVVAREVALGVPLSSALESLAKRLPQPEIRTFVAALNRATRHGAPLSDTLAGQARAARFALARRIREDAARAGPKIQLVVALLLVPSVLLLVAAALAAALLDGGGEGLPL